MVKVGQFWEDMDKRERGRRRVEVVSVKNGKASCSVWTKTKDGTWMLSGKKTLISVSRMKPGSTGYRLIG